MVFLIARFLGISKQASEIIEYINVEGARPGHDLRYALNGAKLLDMGWNPPVPFEKSLERTVNWTVKNPIWVSL